MGFSYVDTPKGDLDSSGTLDPYYKTVGYHGEIYPFGTSEEWPHMENTHGDLIDNTAHWYQECSNNGYCDRTTGLCDCLENFWGSSCQRMRCPGYSEGNECTGHGQCLPVQKIAEADYGNIYEMWDKKISYGCLCDAGYYGGNCEERYCKKALDPMYVDDVQTTKWPIFHLAIMTTATTVDFNDGYAQPTTARLKVRFYDTHGHPWLTAPLVPGTFTCADLVQALEDIPGNVVPAGGTICTETKVVNENPLDSSTGIGAFTFAYNTRYTFISNGGSKAQSFRYKPTFWDAGFRNSYDSDDSVVGSMTGSIYRLEFYNNPGVMLPLEVETFLGDGKLPSTVSPGGDTIFRSWTDGQQGEENDYFANHCKDVTVTIDISGGVYFLTGLTAAEKYLLKACLSSSDWDPSNNQDIQVWDKGSVEFPHLIRMLRSHTDNLDGGYYVALVYDTTIQLDNLGTEGTFRLLTPFNGDYNSLEDLTEWEVYTTHGTLELTSDKTQATFDFASNILFTSNTTVPADGDLYHGDMSCEGNTTDTTKNAYLNLCLMKNDIIMLMDPYTVANNPEYMNMYTIKRLYTTPTREYFRPVAFEKYFEPETSPKSAFLYNYDFYNAHVLNIDLTTNWAHSATGSAVFRIYKFTPSIASTYRYIAECSNRGICNTYDGICDCFSGYAGEACTEQNALAV